MNHEGCVLPIQTVFLYFKIPSLDKRQFPTEPAGYLSDVKMPEIETNIRYYLCL
jgi:mRNA-degrading endonuclease toxin of MazEF toxin-antitoxin module